MLRVMRDYAGSWAIKVILGAIVIVFVFWGVGSFRSQRMNEVAVVNGEPIALEEYIETYNNMVNRYRQQFGNNLNDEMLEMLNLKQQALDQLIDQTLMRQKAQEFNFRVSNQELAETIQQIPAFQNDGHFDKDLYTRVLNLNRLTPESFEAMQRDAMLVDKLRSFIMKNVRVSDQEAKEWYEWQNAAVNLDYVLFAPSGYEDIAPTDEEVKAYYEANKENYKTEQKVKARYLHFSPEDYQDQVSVTEEEVEAYYAANPDEFKEPETVSARHILFTLEPSAAEEEVEEKRQDALEVMEMARQGADFAELAQEYSEGPTKDRGGDLGEFTRERMVKPFADKAFSMAPGEISEPVRTQFGWHVIKVEKVNPATEKSLEEVSDEIRTRLSQEKARAAGYDAAEEVYDTIFDGDDLAEVAEVRQMTTGETDFFTRQGPEDIPGRGQFATTAFTLEPMQISDIQDFGGDGYYIIQVTEKIEPETAAFEAVKDQVRADLVRERQDEKARADAEAFLTALKEGTGMAEVGQNYPQTTVKTTGEFKRNEAIPEIGREQEITQAAFSLSPSDPLPETPLKGRSGYFVIRFKEKKAPEMSEFQEEKESVKERMVQQKQYQAFSTWLGQMRENSEISTREEMLN